MLSSHHAQLHAPLDARQPTNAEGTLRDEFLGAGFVWEVHVPLKPDGKHRGFGFVSYTRRAHAEKAMELFNGRFLSGRPIAVDWCVLACSARAQ